ncbi:response regulator transcription factor [Lampropedia puyangensis]|uniref:Response regulator transcription factor n=1 Tax=Lampropedia puyangensis TaxID=1330072 RepID=A0A4S8FF45_9BURK|nr:response regulator transcription factor [Lampropedia puyangensis]THU05465.1 response regulator transcription factor [Lampropedia puyangensis]
MSLRPHILVVEDDFDMSQLIATFLHQAQFNVKTAEHGDAMREALLQGPTDLIVMDLMLPGSDGLDLCKELRAHPTYAKTPIIMLTARGSTLDRVLGLELGADDYLAKPFEPVELLARIKAVLRRSPPENALNPSANDALHNESDDIPATYHFEGWQLNTRARQLHSPEGVVISLANSDYQILQLLLSRPHRPISRDELLEHAFGRERAPNDRTVDVCVSRLRSHLESDSRQPRMIRTIRHEGYMYNGELPRTASLTPTPLPLPHAFS